MNHQKSSFIWVISLFVWVCLFAAEASAADVPRMSKEELKALLGKPDVIVIDVRSDGDWTPSDSKIKGAVREDPPKVTSWMEKYAKNKTLVFYCS